MADCFQCEFGNPLLDFRALNFKQAGFRARALARRFARKATQFREFQCGQIDFKFRNLALEKWVGDQWAVTVLLCAGNRFDLLNATLRTGNGGNAGTLMRQQELGAGPALVFFINAIGNGYADVFQPYFVDFMLATQGDDWANGYAGRLHVDEKETNAFLRLGIGIGADEEEAPVCILRHRGPCLLTVHDIMVAIADGLCAQRSKVRTCARFRIPLAPPIVAGQDAGQELCFLLGRAECVDHGSDHRQTKWHGADAICCSEFFGPDETLRCGPASAAIFDRPCWCDPAFFRKNAMP